MCYEIKFTIYKCFFLTNVWWVLLCKMSSEKQYQAIKTASIYYTSHRFVFIKDTFRFGSFLSIHVFWSTQKSMRNERIWEKVLASTMFYHNFFFSRHFNYVLYIPYKNWFYLNFFTLNFLRSCQKCKKENW